MKTFFKVLGLLLAIAVAFLAGFAACALRGRSASAPETPAQSAAAAPAAPELRVFDGDVQWHDGVRWQLWGSAEELVQNDPIAAARALAAAQATAAGDAPADEVLGLNRGVGSLSPVWAGGAGGSAAGGGTGGGSTPGGGGGGGSDGEDISWSGDYL